MTSFTEGGQPEVGDHLDESALLPLPKAYTPPLHVSDEVHFQLQLGQDSISLGGNAKIRRGLDRLIHFSGVVGTATTAAAVAVLLCFLWHAPGWAVVAIGAAVAAAVLTLGIWLCLIPKGSPTGHRSDHRGE